MSDSMHDEKKIPLPLGMLILEFFGSVLIALGIAKKWGDIDVLPAITKYDQSGWLLIGLGVLLTLPFLLYIIAKVREKTLQNSTH
jgi:hypothetical protein